MRKLILVRHSIPEKDPTLPANQWQLTEEGRLLCGPLAKKLAAYRPLRITASLEPKATETARLIAQQLSLPFEMAEGLHEHKRRKVGYLGKEEFEAKVTAFFEQPGQLVFGEETAVQTFARFNRAVTNLLEKYPAENIVVVTHGTVMSLFVAEYAGVRPVPFWQSLELPCFITLSLPEPGVLETSGCQAQA